MQIKIIAHFLKVQCETHKEKKMLMSLWPLVDLKSFILERHHGLILSQILSVYFCSTILLDLSFEFFNTSNL